MTPKKKAAKKATNRIPKARLAEMIEKATVDAYDESEQATGWFTMLEDNLELPFETWVLGVSVRVTRIDQRDDDRLVAICVRDRNDEQAIGLVDLPLPTPMPPGAEWIEALALGWHDRVVAHVQGSPWSRMRRVNWIDEPALCEPLRKRESADAARTFLDQR